MLRTAAIAALGFATTSAFKIAEDQLLKRDGAHGHDHEASSGYGAPAQSYEEPAASYGAPAPSYGAPATGYGAPSDSYGVSYQEEEALPDLTPIIIGILVLTGLSLLFPTFVSLSSVRRKRDADDGKRAHKRAHKRAPNYGYSIPPPMVMLLGHVRCQKGLKICIWGSFLTHFIHKFTAYPHIY